MSKNIINSILGLTEPDRDPLVFSNKVCQIEYIMFSEESELGCKLLAWLEPDQDPIRRCSQVHVP